jgi:hypothetical protein
VCGERVGVVVAFDPAEELQNADQVRRAGHDHALVQRLGPAIEQLALAVVGIAAGDQPRDGQQGPGDALRGAAGALGERVRVHHRVVTVHARGV